ncbi:hypothetical protein CLOM_g4406 [Closterium sp. NIES-68]|nr:hypothetical protein CLOM_g4406 [Closterium sp. NIES-68]
MESRDVIFHEGLNYKGWKERGASHSGTSNQDPHTASIFEGAWEDPGDEGEEQQEEPEPADSNHEESRETDSTPQPATQADLAAVVEPAAVQDSKDSNEEGDLGGEAAEAGRRRGNTSATQCSNFPAT